MTVCPGAGTVAIMQPYFFPYAGYFRLLRVADLFVIYDCVQFPRRGRVHRTQVPAPGGGFEWLTLPLLHQPRDVLIRDLAFAPDARRRFDARLARYNWLGTAQGAPADRLRDYLYGPLPSVIDYLEAGLRLCASLLGLDTPIMRASTLDVDPALRGQDRVIATVQAAGGRTFVNPPGGRALYQAEAFAPHGLALCFLAPYEGAFFQLLAALLSIDPGAIRADIERTSRWEIAAPVHLERSPEVTAGQRFI